MRSYRSVRACRSSSYICPSVSAAQQSSGRVVWRGRRRGAGGCARLGGRRVRGAPPHVHREGRLLAHAGAAKTPIDQRETRIYHIVSERGNVDSIYTQHDISRIISELIGAHLKAKSILTNTLCNCETGHPSNPQAAECRGALLSPLI